MTVKNSYSLVQQVRINDTDYRIGVNYQHITWLINRMKVFDFYAGCLVFEGSGTYTDWQNVTHEVGPGCLVQHLPGKYHHIQRARKGWCEYTLVVDRKLYDYLNKLGFIIEKPILKTGVEPVLIEQFKVIYKILQNLDNYPDKSVLINEIILFFNKVKQCCVDTEPVRKHNVFIDEAKSRLGQDYSCDLDLHELAGEYGVSYTRFRSLFKEETGQSPGAWRKECRLNQARLRLRHTRLRISELALEMGYADQYSFSKEFKRRFGISPRHFNQSHT